MKTLFKIIVLTSIILLFTKPRLEAQTLYFQDTISNDTILNADTIKVTGDITVLSGVTLTITQGTYIEFQDYYKLNVQGRLVAIGDINDTIIFSVKDTTGFSDTSIVNGGWHGIHFDNTPNSNDTSKIFYCKLMYGKAVGDTLPEYAGGAVYIYDFSKVVISNSLICNNLVIKHGGGIYCGKNSSPCIKNNRFTNNISYYEGGGVYIGKNSNAKILGNIFTNNMAYSLIYMTVPPYLIFEGGSGGGIYSTSADLNSYCPFIINNKFFNNKAVGGGGIYESNYNICIINNIICNNEGSGIYNGHQLGKGKYFNNTICNNSKRGGILCHSSSLEIINNIIWGNTNFNPNDSTNQINIGLSADPSVIYCNIQYGYSGEGNIDTLPLFIQPTGDAGIAYNGETADWSLQNNSLCINNGTPDTTGLSIPLTDIFGNPRIYDNRIDIGAIESQFQTNIELVQLTDNSIYPNPASNKLYIQTSLRGTIILEMYDITGKKVYDHKLTGPLTTLDIRFLRSGLFFCRLTDGKKIIYSGKIIKQ